MPLLSAEAIESAIAWARAAKPDKMVVTIDDGPAVTINPNPARWTQLGNALRNNRPASLTLHKPDGAVLASRQLEDFARAAQPRQAPAPAPASPQGPAEPPPVFGGAPAWIPLPPAPASPPALPAGLPAELAAGLYVSDLVLRAGDRYRADIVRSELGILQEMGKVFAAPMAALADQNNRLAAICENQAVMISDLLGRFGRPIEIPPPQLPAPGAQDSAEPDTATKMGKFVGAIGKEFAAGMIENFMGKEATNDDKD